APSSARTRYSYLRPGSRSPTIHSARSKAGLSGSAKTLQSRSASSQTSSTRFSGLPTESATLTTKLSSVGVTTIGAPSNTNGGRVGPPVVTVPTDPVVAPVAVAKPVVATLAV